MRKKFLAMLLCVCTVVALLPTAANAFDGTAWEDSDSIGIYMLKAGTTDLSERAENRKYVYVPDDNGFSASGDAIELPVNGSTVDFRAYYPHHTLTDGAMNLDLSDQSNLSAIDLMTATAKSIESAPIDKNHTNIELLFSPCLAKLQVKVAAGSGVASGDLEGLKVEITKQRTSCVYAPMTNSIHDENQTGPKTVTLHNSSDGALHEGILMPTTDTGGYNPIIAGRQLVVTLSNGERFSYNIPDDLEFNAGILTTIDLELNSVEGTNKANLTNRTNTSRGTFEAALYQTKSLTAGEVTRTSDANATVKFSSEREGKYGYVVEESSTTKPGGIDENSFSLLRGENTIRLTNLTAGAKYIYIQTKKDRELGVGKIIEITIPEYVPITHAVTLVSGTGYTLTPETGSTSPVTDGGTYSFKVTLDANYEKSSSFAIKVNGNVLTATNDVYTIKNIIAPQTVTVEGVVLKGTNYDKVDAAIANSPQTGDNSNMILWIFLLILSSAAVVVLRFSRKFQIGIDTKKKLW